MYEINWKDLIQEYHEMKVENMKLKKEVERLNDELESLGMAKVVAYENHLNEYYKLNIELEVYKDKCKHQQDVIDILMPEKE